MIYGRLPFFKITLIHKLSKLKYFFYQSTTEGLKYDESVFTSEIQSEKTPRASW